jgi:hypothetical protein
VSNGFLDCDALAVSSVTFCMLQLGHETGDGYLPDNPKDQTEPSTLEFYNDVEFDSIILLKAYDYEWIHEINNQTLFRNVINSAEVNML